MRIQKAINQALKLHQAGKLDEASAQYLELLPLQQKNPQLLYLLGTSFMQAGKSDCCR